MDVKHIKSFYFSQVYSRLLYGICFWGSSPHACRVFLCQKRIVRCMFGAGGLDSCRPLFKEHRILPLVCIYILEICIFMHQNKNITIKNSNIHKHDTRNKENLYQNYHRLKVAQSLPQNIGVQIFNHLPKIVKDCISVKAFKTALQGLLIEHCFYTLDEFFNIICVNTICFCFVR
jgi:hypothetical protein